MKNNCHSLENFGKMPPQYGESTDDTNVNQVSFSMASHFIIICSLLQIRGGLRESLLRRNASMIELAKTMSEPAYDSDSSNVSDLAYNGEPADDSEEFEGVETNVHQDAKNTEVHL